jgi:hypothetical protein
MDILSEVASVALPFFGFYAAVWWCYQDYKSKKRLRQALYNLEQSQRAHTELTHKFVEVRMEQMGL